MTAAEQIRKGSRGMAAIAAMNMQPSELAALAYVGIYACGFEGRGSLEKFKRLATALTDTAFLTELQRSVPERRTLEGWTVRGWDGTRVYLDFDSIRTFVSRDQLLESDLIKNHTLALDFPVIIPGILPGFVFRRGAKTCGAHPMSKFYLNVASHQAALVLGTLARRLDASRLRFEMKVLAHPRAYLRRDSAVVYVLSEDAGKATETLSDAIAEDGITLGRTVPLLTKELIPGLGFAEEPLDVAFGYSHGQWVSSLFLEAARESREPKAIATAVLRQIRKIARDPEKPYLRAKPSNPRSA